RTMMKLTLTRIQNSTMCNILGKPAACVVGIYTLNRSRVHAPGSVVGKRLMAGMGVCFLVASGLQWT
ncbi:hypothetical protein L226DRAFT_447851, partial [Lentinus tigrinus ALCF2SS1-7]|uniref:uncharacterized protein n=1 Tax=Lentinus tigrinus ALCF2SS1-7 TaxID=1328758 RepID=UPI001165D0C5